MDSGFCPVMMVVAESVLALVLKHGTKPRIKFNVTS